MWEEVEARTSESATLSISFVVFMVLATLIAAVGILTDSLILIIGAMVVGPEFGPLAGVSVAIVERRLSLARRSLVALAVGFPVASVAADPRDPTTYANLGTFELEQGNPQAAADWFTEALTVDPSSESARQGLLAAHARP